MLDSGRMANAGGRWARTCALLLLACCTGEQRPVTQVVVVVDSDLVVGQTLMRVEIAVQTEDGARTVGSPFPFELTDRASALKGKHTLPLSFGIVRPEGGSDRFRVVVSGFGPDAEGRLKRIVETTALAAFRTGRTMQLNAFLRDVCVGRACEEQGDGEEWFCYPWPEQGIAAGDCGPLPAPKLVEIIPGEVESRLGGDGDSDPPSRLRREPPADGQDDPGDGKGPPGNADAGPSGVNWSDTFSQGDGDGDGDRSTGSGADPGDDKGPQPLQEPIPPPTHTGLDGGVRAPADDPKTEANGGPDPPDAGTNSNRPEGDPMTREDPQATCPEGCEHGPCGSDGCPWGSCDKCPMPQCGDGVCNGSETMHSCCQDCGCSGTDVCEHNACSPPCAETPFRLELAPDFRTEILDTWRCGYVEAVPRAFLVGASDDWYLPPHEALEFELEYGYDYNGELDCCYLDDSGDECLALLDECTDDHGVKVGCVCRRVPITLSANSCSLQVVTLCGRD